MTLTPNVQATVDQRRAQAIAEIEGQTTRYKFNSAGLAWLSAHGEVRPKSDMSLNMGNTAAGMAGYREAQALINTTMREMWPLILAQAIVNAQRGNDEAREIIKKASPAL